MIKCHFYEFICKYYQAESHNQKIINQYHNRAITSAEVINRLVELAKEMRQMNKRAREMNLTEEEIIFYDIISQVREAIVSNKDTKKRLIRISGTDYQE